MPAKFTDQYRRQVVAAYDQARRDGAPVGKAALLAGGGHSVSVIEHWREVLADDSDDGPRQIAKRRACLRCRRDFRSTWSGERICGRCKGGEHYDGLPAGWGQTATLSVADRD